MEEKTAKCSIFFSLWATKENLQEFNVFKWTILQSSQHFAAESISVWLWFLRGRTHCWTCLLKYSEKWQMCQAFTLHWSQLPRQQYQHIHPSFLLEKYYIGFENLLKSGLSKKQPVAKLRKDNVPPTGTKNYVYLQTVWENERMQRSAAFLKWWNKKDFFPKLKKIQKILEIHDEKRIYMLKLGCTLPNMANERLHKSTDSKTYPFTETDRTLFEKIREDVIGCLHPQSCSREKFYREVNESVQIHCGYWC